MIVNVPQGLQKTATQLNRRRQTKRPLLQPLFQGEPFDERHHQIEQVLVPAQIEKRCDEGAFDLPERPGFMLQPHLSADGKTVPGGGLDDNRLVVVIRPQKGFHAMPLLELARNAVAAAEDSRVRAIRLMLVRWEYP